MAKVKYRLNQQTLEYEKIKTPVEIKILRAFVFFLPSVIIGFAFYMMFSSILPSPREKVKDQEYARLLAQFKMINKELAIVTDELEDIQQRDENVYRAIFRADPISNSIRKAGFGGVRKYEALETMENAEIVIETREKLDVIIKQMYVQSVSFDDIEKYAAEREEMMSGIPAIQPVSNKDLSYTASGYGYRIDPIYKTKKFHHGMDFTAPTGTKVYSTGDGVVSEVSSRRSGYGNKIEIDHGYGYVTLYAHLSKFNVKKGQKVKRGQVIGFVGNTGKSTGPHLHYEVQLNNKSKNPANYYFKDLSANQYEKLVKISNSMAQTLD